MLAELAAAVRSGAVTPRQLVDEALRRIERDNPALNAVVAVNAEQARAEADDHPRTGALAGLPLLVKDLARARGLRTTFGSRLYADAPIDTVDDAIVARYKAAGAIVIGKANTPAFGHMAVTNNFVFGPTRNPWNLACSPGGSSGGSAAALAAQLTPLATTSDGGGSVRLPASLCGLVGYKPTFGALGRDGAPRWMTFSSMGGTGRTVADAVLEASVICGTVPGDLYSAPSPQAPWTPQRPRRAVVARTLRADVDASIEAAMAEAVAELAAAGMEIEHIEAPIGSAESYQWFVISSVELAQTLASQRDRLDDWDPGLLFNWDMAQRFSAFDYVAAQRGRFAACARIDALLGDDTVLLTPTINAEAWPAEGPMATKAGSTVDGAIAVNTPEFNYTGHPGVSVPIGIDSQGVPIGMQVIGPRWRDGLALGVAELLESRRPWPLGAPGYEPFGV
jgi:amidase